MDPGAFTLRSNDSADNESHGSGEKTEAAPFKNKLSKLICATIHGGGDVATLRELPHQMDIRFPVQ